MKTKKMDKNKKNLQIGLIITVGVLIFSFLMSVIYKKKQNIIPVTNQNSELPITQKDEGTVPLTEEKKVELAAIKNIKGKIIATENSNIEVETTEGEKITLKAPLEGANFSILTKQEDGSFMVKAVGLSEIPKNKEADIQYNSTTNEVLLVNVK